MLSAWKLLGQTSPEAPDHWGRLGARYGSGPPLCLHSSVQRQAPQFHHRAHGPFVRVSSLYDAALGRLTGFLHTLRFFA